MTRQKPMPMLTMIFLAAGCAASSASAPGDRGFRAAAEQSAVAHSYDFTYRGESTISRTALQSVFAKPGDDPGDAGVDHILLEIKGVLRRIELQRDPHHRIEHVEIADALAHLRTIGPDGTPATTDLGASLRAGFFVEFEPNGRARGVALPADTPEIEARLAQSIAALLQWSQSSDPLEVVWRAQEPHPNGVATVEYRCTAIPAGRSTEMREVRRTCVAFHPPRVSAASDLDLAYTIEPSGEHVAMVPADSEAWNSLNGCASLKASIRGRVVSETSECVDVRRTGSAPVDAASAATLLARCAALVEESGWIPIGGAASGKADEIASHRLTLGKETSATLEAALARVDENTDGATLGRLTRKLAALLALAPEQFGAFEHHLLESSPDSWRCRIVAGAVAASGSPAAQELLANAIRRASQTDRLTTILIAIAECRRPGGALVREVSRLSRQSEPELRSTAMLVLGALAATSDEAIRTEIVASLRERLEQGPADERRIVILALGNAAPPELAAILAPHADAPEPATRAAVARVLASGDSHPVEQILVRLAFEDNDAEVRGTAVSALAERPRIMTTWTVALRRLSTEPDMGVRSSLLQALWRRAPELPQLDSQTHALAQTDPAEAVRELAARLLAERATK